MPGQMPEMMSKGDNLRMLDSFLVVGPKQAVARAALQALLDDPTDGDRRNPNDTKAQDALRDALIALIGFKGTYQVFGTQDVSDHFEKDWLTFIPGAPPIGWWPEAQPAAPVLIQGYIKAIDIALASGPERTSGAPLPIESVWVCTPPTDFDAGTDQSGRIHVGITWSAKVVTVVIYTPRIPPIGAQDPLPGKEEPVVVVRWEGAPKSKLRAKRPGA